MTWKDEKTLGELSKVKNPEEYKKQAKAAFRKAVGEELWEFLEEEENEAKQKAYKLAKSCKNRRNNTGIFNFRKSN